MTGRSALVVSACVSTLGIPLHAQDINPDTIDAWFERVVAERDFSGVVLIARGQDVLLHEGYGEADDSGTPMTDETVVPTGSISKQFTAAAVLLLVERGLLDVDDRIGLHLAEVPPDKESITLHHLLTHTAGFTQDHFEHDLTPITLDEALEAIYALPLGFEPGTEYSYSNTGYALLAAIVQSVSGRRFTEFMRQDVFEHFGLTATGFFEGDWSGHPVAVAYHNGSPQGRPSGFPGPFWGNMGNGGVMSTTGDLFRWITLLRTDRVLKRRHNELLFGPHVSSGPGRGYGYGWSTTDSTALGREVGHGGVGIGGNSEMAFYPDQDLTIIVLSNRARFRFRDGRLIEANLPAREARDQLLQNIVANDFSALPEPSLRPDRHTRIVMIALLAVGTIVATIAIRRRLRSSKATASQSTAATS